ncbi:MAG: rhodanese-related sulfurtransferase [Flavobacteriales bacterium]|nr:rhodanese-related sulfurtransferase [Flavobacteriales bacterium]MDP4717300.1 rhodanese-related sulfurtransferase [Flavobacteriales bacterium]MDP4818678.1 rhodanese-related sulfurtransferase [Flavobacteriales bacterium]MDP4951837.1 rhodanese-related sulfurtransferase [Flavobacteriales bacterium]
MKKLYNTEDKRVLRQRMLADNTPRTTVSFYKYHQIEDPQGFRDALFARWNDLGVLGRTYIASEGINAQISVPTENFEAFVKDLFTIDFLNGIRLNTSVDEGKSFYALKVKLRNKIVADGIEDPNFDPSNTGKYLTADEWNQQLSHPNTVVVDMRNHYESEVGHFEGAICPDVDTFREELQVVEDILQNDKDKKVLMYCTGGIRCEKASAYMKHKGFENVYHLEGGIIKYARDAKENNLDIKFKGVNFVFDERLAERISDEVIATCHQCGEPFDHHTNCLNLGCHILFIQCDKCKEKYENCCSEECQSITHLSEEEQKELRKKTPVVRNVYKKGRMPKLTK